MSKRRTFSIEEKLSVLREVEENGITETCRRHDLSHSVVTRWRKKFESDGDGPGKGGEGTLYVNDEKVGNARIERTQGNIFSAEETADVGLDNQTPVALGIGYGPEETKFNGKIKKVVVDIK